MDPESKILCLKISLGERETGRRVIVDDKEEDKNYSKKLKSMESNTKKSFKNVRSPQNQVTDRFTTHQELISEFIMCASLCHECIVEEPAPARKNIIKEGEESDVIGSIYQSSSPDEVAICNSMKQIGSEYLGSKFGISRLNFFGNEKNFKVKMVRKFL